MTKQGIIYVALATFFSGFAIVVNKMALIHQQDPIFLITFTHIFAAFLGLPEIIKQRRMLTHLRKRTWLQIFVVGILATGIASLVLIFGLQYTTAINGSFLASLSAFFTLPFAVILLGDRIEKSKYPLILMLLVGLYLFVVGTTPLKINSGDILIIIAAILWGFTNAYVKRPLKKISGLLMANLRFLMGALFLLCILILYRGVFIISLASVGWFVLSGFLIWGYVVFFYKSVSLNGPIVTSLVTVFYPVVAGVSAVFLLNETFTITKILGGILILLSIYKILREGNKHA